MGLNEPALFGAEIWYRSLPMRKKLLHQQPPDIS